MSRQTIKRNVGTLLLAATLAVSLSGYVSGQLWRRLSGQGGTIAEAAKRLRQLQDSQQSRTEDADGQNQVRTGQLNTDAVRRAMDAYRRTQGQPARVVPGQLNTDAVRRAMDAYRRTQGQPARIIPGQLNAEAIRGAMEAREQNEGGRFGLVPGQINAEAVRRAIEAHAEVSRRAEEASAEDPGSVDWPETEDPADWPEADEPADWPLVDGPQGGVSDVQEGIGLVRDIIDVIRDFRNATGPRSDDGFDGGHDGGEYDESEYDDTYNDDVYEFEAGSECWDLRRRTFKVTIDNTENTEDFQFTINGESTAVLAGESQEHEARFPIDLGYDQGDGEEQLLSDQISGGYQVQIDPETQVVTLAAVAPPAR